jgi:hypothetical protein
MPLLRAYCFDCHGADHAEGEAQLGSMPPEDGAKMDNETRARMVPLIDELANAVDCLINPNPGKVTL